MIDAKEVLELVRSKWDIEPRIIGYSLDNIVNGSFEDGTNGWTLLNSTVVDTEHYLSTHSLEMGYTAYALQTFTGIKREDVTTFLLYVKKIGIGMGLYSIEMEFSDESETVCSLNATSSWVGIDILALTQEDDSPLFPVGKTLTSLRIRNLDDVDNIYVDAVTCITTGGDVFLSLDEYNPNNPLYQIVFINRPERTLFVSPNVIKHEQDIIVETHVKQIRHDPDNVDAKRTIFKNIKGELSRIFNTYRFDEVGSTLNVSAWVDAKLPHGFGMEADPLEFSTRLTMQIFYYESLDGTSVGVRVSKVTILDNDLTRFNRCSLGRYRSLGSNTDT